MQYDGGGFYAYLATPYDAKGDVDVGVLKEYVTEVLRFGVDGVTCIASTCEGPYLTESERQLVAETVGDAVGGRARLNIGVGALSTRQVIEYAKHARDAGAACFGNNLQGLVIEWIAFHIAALPTSAETIKPMNSRYNAADIEVLSGLDPVKRRPGAAQRAVTAGPAWARSQAG